MPKVPILDAVLASIQQSQLYIIRKHSDTAAFASWHLTNIGSASKDCQCTIACRPLSGAQIGHRLLLPA